MSDASPITPEIARILADWSGLHAEARPGAELAEVFEAFHQRVQRLYCTKGIRTTAGSRILRDFVPSEDATATTRLAEAGAVLVGKTNLHEFAAGVTTDNPHFGTCQNPWKSRRALPAAGQRGRIGGRGEEEQEGDHAGDHQHHADGQEPADYEEDHCVDDGSVAATHPNHLNHDGGSLTGSPLPVNPVLMHGFPPSDPAHRAARHRAG